MKCLVVLVFLIATATSGVVERNERIANGNPATAGQFPYLISLSENGEHKCGGFIYNSEWVVTAASCVTNKLPSQLKVTVAQLSLINAEDPEEETLSVFSIIPYSGYNSTSRLHDIALLQTSTPIAIGTANVDFITYEEPETGSTAGKATVAGFGTSQINGSLNTKLRYTEVTIAGSNCTGPAYSGFNPSYMLCAGTSADEGGPCTLDEGAPLVQDQTAGGSGEVAVGIVSNKLNCGNKTSTVYTRLASYYAWLISTAGTQPSTTG